MFFYFLIVFGYKYKSLTPVIDIHNQIHNLSTVLRHCIRSRSKVDLNEFLEQIWFHQFLDLRFACKYCHYWVSMEYIRLHHLNSYLNKFKSMLSTFIVLDKAASFDILSNLIFIKGINFIIFGEVVSYDLLSDLIKLPVICLRLRSIGLYYLLA